MTEEEKAIEIIRNVINVLLDIAGVSFINALIFIQVVIAVYAWILYQNEQQQKMNNGYKLRIWFIACSIS